MAFDFGSPSGITYGTGVYGQSVSGGTASRANVLPSATQFTIDIRVKALAGAVIVALGQADAFWIGILNTVKAFAQVGTGGTEVNLEESTGSLGDGNFHAIRLSAGPSGCVLLVDGVVKASSATTPTAAGVLLTGALGLRNLGGSFTWVGDVDEIAIWSVEMPGAYTPGPVSDSAANLVAVWHLDGNLLDSKTVAAAFTGTLTNDDATVSGTFSSMPPSSFAGALVGDDAAVNGSFGAASGTFTSPPLSTNNGTLLTLTALSYVAAYNATTGALVARFTGLTTDASARFTVASVALPSGTPLRWDWETAGGERRMPLGTPT